MNLQQFWQLRESESGSPEISSKIIVYFRDSLAALLAAPVEIYREKRASRGIHTRWRTLTTQAGVLSLGLEGTLSITLGQNSPRVKASLFLFFGKHKLFPQDANQGYLHMKYDPEQGWKTMRWYMDEFNEFSEKKYSGKVPVYQSITISKKKEKPAYESLLHQILNCSIKTNSRDILSFSSEEPLFGILIIEFIGELKPVSDNPHKIEMTIRFQSSGNSLAIGEIEKIEKVLSLESLDEKTWDYKWKDQ